MKPIIFLVLTLTLIFASCDPISLKDGDGNNERDIVADVRALVSPDTVQSGIAFTVQLSFPQMCGGTYKYNIIRADTLNNIVIEPVIHYVPGAVCPAVVLAPQTVTSSITITTTGQYTLGGVGDLGVISKKIVVVPAIPHPTTYRMNYLFQNRNGDPLSLYSTNFQLTSLSPIQSFTITTDTLGRWDTTFTNIVSTLNYSLAGFELSAKQGIKESGIIIIP